jgi:hypothetical protein
VRGLKFSGLRGGTLNLQGDEPIDGYLFFWWFLLQSVLAKV